MPMQAPTGLTMLAEGTAAQLQSSSGFPFPNPKKDRQNKLQYYNLVCIRALVHNPACTSTTTPQQIKTKKKIKQKH